MSGLHCLLLVALIIFKFICSTCINHTLVPFLRHIDNMQRPCWWWYGPNVISLQNERSLMIWGVLMLAIIRLYITTGDTIKLTQLSKYQDSFRFRCWRGQSRQVLKHHQADFKTRVQFYHPVSMFLYRLFGLYDNDVFNMNVTCPETVVEQSLHGVPQLNVDVTK